MGSEVRKKGIFLHFSAFSHFTPKNENSHISVKSDSIELIFSQSHLFIIRWFPENLIEIGHSDVILHFLAPKRPPLSGIFQKNGNKMGVISDLSCLTAVQNCEYWVTRAISRTNLKSHLAILAYFREIFAKFLFFRIFSLICYSHICLLYTSPSPRDRSLSRMPSSA